MRKLLLLLFFYLVTINCNSQNNLNDLKFLILSSKYIEALELSDQLLKENPENSDLYYQQALINKLSFKFHEAEQSIKKALEIDSLNLHYLAEYGFILLKTDKDIKAQKAFRQVIKSNPYDIHVGIPLSDIYLKHRKPEKAEKILLDLYTKDTLNNFVTRKLGVCAYRQGDSKKSIKWFAKSIKLDSTDIKAYKFLFSVYAAKEKYDQAFEIIDKAISIAPWNKDLYKKAGDLNIAINQPEKAVVYYLKAFEIDNKDGDIAGKLGLSYNAIKKYEKAKHYLLIANSDPDVMDLDVYRSLGEIYSQSNKPDSSTIFFKKALEILRPDFNSIFNIYINIAKNHYELGNYIHTVEWYKRAIKLELSGAWTIDNRNMVLVDLASVYADKLNDKNLAIKYLKEITIDISINDDRYYNYAQREIAKLNEELFMEGKL